MPSTPSPPSTAGDPSPPPPENTTTTAITTVTTTVINHPNPNSIPTPTPPQPTIRKFPAPCWTQDETLALINAYQDKWYSLRRRNLRTADWESVADEVNRRCPNQSPPKTSAQCRHKMEKLRKRYRAEKQRINSLPSNHNFVANNRFFPSSSWVFFDLMDSMEVGSGSVPGSRSVVVVKEKESLNLLQNNGVGSSPFIKEEKNLKVKDDLGKYFDEILMSMGKNTNTNTANNNNSVGSMKFKVKNNQNDRYFDDNESKYHYDYDGNDNGNRNGGGFDYINSNNKSGRNFGGGFSGMISNNKRKFGVGGVERYGEEASSKMMYLNGGGSSSKRGFGSGRGKDPVVGEMAASIKLLGEGLIRMETMKMEMMQDIERKRMEMEMKRNEMMLESQHTIVNAFLQGLKKHKKSKAVELD